MGVEAIKESEKELDKKCLDTIGHFKLDVSRLRSGRASTALLEGIQVEYYGSYVPLIQLATLGAPEARLITVQIFDKSAVDSVEKAIRQSDLGLNPMREGNLLRVSIPPLTEERRRELVKKLHGMGEDAKISIRNHRRDTIDFIKKQEKAKELSEDDSRRCQEEVQKIVDKYISQIDTVGSTKEKEMMTV